MEFKKIVSKSNYVENYDFMGLKISKFKNLDSIRNFIISSIKEEKKVICFGYSFGIIGLMRKYKQFYNLGQISDLMLTDGRIFYLYTLLIGLKVKELSIPDFVMFILKTANENNLSVYLLGSTKFINEKAVKNLELKYPGIKKLSGRNGYFKEEDLNFVIDDIKKFKPDILLIGMAPPKKEDFILQNKNEILAKIIVPCGGMIDVLAGKYKKTPLLIKKIGMASLYRFIQEPNRLFKRYIYVSITIFLIILPKFILNLISHRHSFSIPRALNISEQ